MELPIVAYNGTVYTYEDKLEPTWLCGNCIPASTYKNHGYETGFLGSLICYTEKALIVTVVMKRGLSALIALQRYVVLLFYHYCKQFMQALLQNHFHYRKQVLQINFKIVNLIKYMLNRDLIS